MSAELYCTNCKEWEQNIDLVTAPNRLLMARSPDTYKGYTGVQFKFCPWCGSRLWPDRQHEGKSGEP